MLRVHIARQFGLRLSIPGPDPNGTQMGIFAELRRCNVFRVGIAYAVTSWLLLQLPEVLYELLELPAWALKCNPLRRRTAPAGRQRKSMTSPVSLAKAEPWYWVSSASRPTWSMFRFLDVSFVREVKWQHPLVKVALYEDCPRYS